MSGRILVTGGAGCIGSELAGKLVARGECVTVLDNLSSGKREHIEELLGAPGFRFVEGDLLDRGAVDEAVAGVNLVYHLAANPDVKFIPGDPTDRDLKQNMIGTYVLLESMQLHGLRRLAFASTSAVYGISQVLPIPESAPLRPISLYGATKAGCEAMISAYHHLFAMDCWIFRFANIVGARVRARGKTVISDFIEKLRLDPSRLEILGDGNQAKSYLLASECVDAMLHATAAAPTGLHVFNLGCTDGLSVRRIADLVALRMGVAGVEYRFTGGEGGWPGDVPRFVLDTRAINDLGWKAGRTSEQAVRHAIEAILST